MSRIVGRRRRAPAVRCACSAGRRGRRWTGSARRARWNSTAGSMSPERVPMTSPSSGVSPIDVSTERPPSIAVTDAPLPRWNTICRVRRAVCRGRPRRPRSRTCGTCRGSRIGGCDGMPRAPRRWRTCRPRAEASGGTRCRRPRRGARRGTPSSRRRCPARFAGLCSGASTDSSSMLISTSGVMSVGSKKRAPPCTTRWPTASRRVLARATGRSRRTPRA